MPTPDHQPVHPSTPFVQPPARPLSPAELAAYRSTIARFAETIDAAGQSLADRGQQPTYLAMATTRTRVALSMLLAAIDDAAKRPDDPELTPAALRQTHTAFSPAPGEPGHGEPLPTWADGVVPDPSTEPPRVLAPNRRRRYVVESGEDEPEPAHELWPGSGHGSALTRG